MPCCPEGFLSHTCLAELTPYHNYFSLLLRKVLVAPELIDNTHNIRIWLGFPKQTKGIKVSRSHWCQVKIGCLALVGAFDSRNLYFCQVVTFFGALCDSLAQCAVLQSFTAPLSLVCIPRSGLRVFLFPLPWCQLHCPFLLFLTVLFQPQATLPSTKDQCSQLPPFPHSQPFPKFLLLRPTGTNPGQLNVSVLCCMEGV